MTRHHRYVGENHFPPPENEGRPHGWHFVDGRECFGPLPDVVRLSLSQIQKAAQSKPETVERRAEGLRAWRASRKFGA